MRGWLVELCMVIDVIFLLWVVFKLEVWGGFLGL